MKKIRRIAAIIAIILLLSMYLVSLIASLGGSEHAQTLFRIAFGLTLGLPVVLYAFLLMARLAKKDEAPKEEAAPPEPEEETPYENS